MSNLSPQFLADLFSLQQSVADTTHQMQQPQSPSSSQFEEPAPKIDTAFENQGPIQMNFSPYNIDYHPIPPIDVRIDPCDARNLQVAPEATVELSRLKSGLQLKHQMAAGLPFNDCHLHLVENRKLSEKACQGYNNALDCGTETKEATLSVILNGTPVAIHNLQVTAPFTCLYGYNIEVGFNIIISEGCNIDDSVAVTFQDGIRLGRHCYLKTSNRADNGLVTAFPIHIGRNCLMEDCVEISGGTRIGEQSMIGRNCIVGRNVTIEQQCSFGIRCIIEDGVKIQDHSRVESNTALRKQASIGFHCLIGIGCVIEKNASLRERCQIELGTAVGENAIIDEDCFIGIGCVIGSGVHIMKGCRIEAGTILQDGSIIGEGCTIRVGCIVEKNVLVDGLSSIGPRSTIQEGAYIGRRVEVGAGCLVGAGLSVCDDLLPGGQMLASTIT